MSGGSSATTVGKEDVEGMPGHTSATMVGKEDLEGMPELKQGIVTRFIRGVEPGQTRVPFHHRELAATRNQAFREWPKTTLLLSAAILGILSLFWGAFIHVERNLGSLVVWVVDFDGQVAPYQAETAIVGPAIVSAAEKIAHSSQPHVGFGSMPPSFFHHDPMEVRRAIYNFDAWAAIIINANATSLLRQAVHTGNSSYDPKGAIQIIYVEARDQAAIDSYIVPELTAFQSETVAAFGSDWAREVMQNPEITRANLAAAPQALSPAIGYTTINLRPFGPPQVTPAVTVGLIYLIIVAFFSYSFFMPTHGHFVNEMEGHRKIYFHHLVLWKYASTFWAYFFMSLSYSLVSLAFQIPFSNPAASHVEPAVNATAYGSASFVVYWMVNLIGMCALGYACENVAMIVGQPYTAIWLIFWVISNVCTAFYPIELAPAFYYYGYAFPLHSIVEASRTILFDLNSRMGLHVGILLAWWAVNTALFPFCAWYLRRKALRAAAAHRK